ncbi:IS200/IS605 family transposase, partial [Psychrobacter sp. 4Dc]|uniref:transposase n=1 Tax=Psychrobacter sp. 4Dc TaxID=888437 RepID=UPI000CCA34F0
MSEIYKNRHAAFNLHVHLVFITKYRKKVLGELHHNYFSECVTEVCKSFDAELKECNGG